MLYLKLAAIGSGLLPQVSASSNSHSNKVLASRLESITLHANQWTTGRRNSPIPQLRCIGGDAEDYYDVQSMRCRAQGSSYDSNNIQWTCTADLPPDFKLGSTQVLCEGYDHPEDPYILKGSCGVEYRLLFSGNAPFACGYEDVQRKLAQEAKHRRDVGAFIFGIVFTLVACFIVYRMVQQWRQNQRNQGQNQPPTDRGRNDGDYDHGLPPPPFDDDDDDEPPPPYWDGGDQGGRPSQDKSSEKSQRVQSSTGSQVRSAGVGSGSSTSAFQRGAGLATGAAVVAGAAIGAAATRVYQRSTGTRPTSETQDREASRARTRTVYTSTSESSSSQSYESIGFGGTTRR